MQIFMPKSYTFRDFDGTYGLKKSIEVGMYFDQILVYSKSISIQSTKNRQTKVAKKH